MQSGRISWQSREHSVMSCGNAGCNAARSMLREAQERLEAQAQQAAAARVGAGGLGSARPFHSMLVGAVLHQVARPPAMIPGG